MENLKTWVVIFWVGIFWRGCWAFTRGEFDLWEFYGREFSWCQFYIREQFCRTTKSNITKIKKRYLFRCNNISSHGLLSFFILTFCIGFTRTENKCVKVIDDDICKRKIEFKAKNEIMKRNMNYRKVDKKIWRVLKEVVALRDFLYEVWFAQFGFWKFVSADN